MKSWSAAWSQAAQRFWSEQVPVDHFRTCAGTWIAQTVAQRLISVDRWLGHPDRLTLVDVGAGDGELLRLVGDAMPDDVRGRLHLVGVDVRELKVVGSEVDVAGDIEWHRVWAPSDMTLEPVVGMVMAHEWLDELAVDVVERDSDGVDRLVVVDEESREHLGPPLDDADECAVYGVDARGARAWMDRWWPLEEPGDRAEIGLPRDRAWQWLTRLLECGLVLATDYGHVSDERRGHHRWGTLVGYRSGRVCAPVIDGSVNLTAHVALDSCVDAVPGTTLTTQRDMLGPMSGSIGDPVNVRDFAQGIAAHSSLAQLRDPAGLGAVGWLQWQKQCGE